VAHASQLAEPGDFVTSAGSAPLLIVRDEERRLRGYLNVCRHRGTQLVDAPCGHKKAFVCPYHAWTYALDGSLTRISHEEGFAGIDKAERGLRQIALAERFGFVWALPASDVSVDDYLGANLCDDFEALGLSHHVPYAPVTFDKQLNWKLGIDIFLEGYHVHYAHRRTIAPMFFDNVNLFDRFAPHIRVVLPKKSITGLRELQHEAWELRPHANVLYMIFPNSLILVQPDHASLFQIYPRGLDRCVIEACTLLPEAPTSDKAKRYWQANIDVLHGAIAEDFALGESIQRGLHSGANQDVLFGRYEQSLAWYHEEIERACS
jgi:phenylpropionate dioxygenase-like ring-hydroxylating dioxygenase large terminal subunit